MVKAEMAVTDSVDRADVVSIVEALLDIRADVRYVISILEGDDGQGEEAEEEDG